MKTEISIKTIFGKVLFEFEKEDNTIKDTLIEAVKSRANLSRADLSGANGLELEKIKKFFWILPEEGSFIAWKKLENNCIAKLNIPVKAERTCNLKNRKCRSSYVKTLSIVDEKGNKIQSAFNGTNENKVKYIVGKITRADSFDDNFMEDCSHGIHFFLTKQEAEEWN